MKNNSLFHVTLIGNQHLIEKYGLIDNMADGIYLCDSDDAAVLWIKKYNPKVKKFLVVEIPRKDLDQSKLMVSTDNQVLVDLKAEALVEEDSQVYLYQQDIPPSVIKGRFEHAELLEDGVEYTGYETDQAEYIDHPIPQSLRTKVQMGFLTKVLTRNGVAKINWSPSQINDFIQEMNSGYFRTKWNEEVINGMFSNSGTDIA